MSEIVIYGDSIMKGVTYDESQNRYKTVKARQFSRLEENGYKVSLFAHMGKTIDFAFQAVKKFTIKNPEKTVAILEFAGMTATSTGRRYPSSRRVTLSLRLTKKSFMKRISSVCST